MKAIPLWFHWNKPFHREAFQLKNRTYISGVAWLTPTISERKLFSPILRFDPCHNGYCNNLRPLSHRAMQRTTSVLSTHSQFHAFGSSTSCHSKRPLKVGSYLRALSHSRNSVRHISSHQFNTHTPRCHCTKTTGHGKPTYGHTTVRRSSTVSSSTTKENVEPVPGLFYCSTLTTMDWLWLHRNQKHGGKRNGL